MKSCRNAGMEMPRCQILPGPSGLGRGGHAAGTARGELCGTGELPGFGKPHRISAPGRFLCQANLEAPCHAEPAVALLGAGPAAHQRTSCSLGALIGAAHPAQEGNIGQRTRILPRRLGHRHLPETPAAAPRLLGGEEKRIAFVRGRKNF